MAETTPKPKPRTRTRDVLGLPQRWMVSAETQSLPLGRRHEQWGRTLADLSDEQWYEVDMNELSPELVDEIEQDELATVHKPPAEVCRLAKQEGGLVALATSPDPAVAVLVNWEETDRSNVHGRRREGNTLGIPLDTRVLAGTLAVHGSDPTLCTFWNAYFKLQDDGTWKLHDAISGGTAWTQGDRRFEGASEDLHMSISYKPRHPPLRPRVRTAGLVQHLVSDDESRLEDAYEQAAFHVRFAWEEPQMLQMLLERAKQEPWGRKRAKRAQQEREPRGRKRRPRGVPKGDA